MSRIYVTSDLDWASEDVILQALQVFAKAEAPFTFFQTHYSNALIRFAKEHGSELEWHPNFLPCSSHGGSVKEVIASLSALPAEKKVVRCHLYYCPEEPYQHFLSETGIKASSNDLSLLSLKPIYKKNGITEIPLFFEDGRFIKAGHPMNVDTILKAMKTDGDYVFLFHPIHVAFNSLDYGLTRSLKDNLSREEYHRLSSKVILEKRYQGYGVANLFLDLIRELKASGHSFHLMKEALPHD